MERIHRLILGCAILLAALLLFGSCKTVQTIEKVNYRDSTIYNFRDSVVYDHRDSINVITQHVVVYDSTKVVIQFGQGGGTYNAKTGEATNVSNVQQTDTHHEERDSTAFYKSLYEKRSEQYAEALSKSQQYEYELEKERKNARNGYDRFCSWWFWITALLLAALFALWICDKIPACKPWTTVIKAALRL